jgi:hypothetical protein
MFFSRTRKADTEASWNPSDVYRTHPQCKKHIFANLLTLRGLQGTYLGPMPAVVIGVLQLDIGIIAGEAMTMRKMILLTLAVLVPCGLLIVALSCLVKSSFVGRFLKDPQAVIG